MADSDAPPNVVPLSRLRAALARPRGAKRIDALLSADDAAAAVAALPVPELYFLVAEVGIGDAIELLSLATPEQVQGCIDFDAWDRDRASPEALMPWLAAALDAGFERFTQVWEGLDPELTALFLARTTRIYDRSLDETAPEDEERPWFTTPDTFFDVVVTTEDEEEGKLVYQIVDHLYRGDMVVARHSLMAARSEVQSELEEMSYRWRSGRMADLGYADFYDALEVFRPLDPSSVHIGEGTADGLVAAEGEPSELPAPMLDQVVGRAFLARALERVVDAREAERLQAALLVLVNKVLSAARVPPGDAEAVVVGTEHATATLALGLEHVSGGDVERAVEALATISLTRLHRLGYSLTLRLARFGRMLAPRAGAAGEPSASVLAGLLAARPFYASALDEGGAAGGVRPFESVADLRRAADHLTELALRIAIADALGADLIALSRQPEPRPDLDDTPRTALVRLLSSGVLDAAPLSAAELEAFRRRDLRGEHARDLALSAMSAALDRAEVVESRDRLPHLVDGWLADLADLDALPPDQPVDPRFVTGLITSAAKH